MRCDLRHDGSYPGGCPFGDSKGDPRGGQKKSLAMLIFLVSELGGLKVEVSYSLMVKCNIICDAICDMT